MNSKTTIRGAASRSFGPITYEGSSSHNLGIVQRITVNDQSQGLNPLWVLQNGAPAWAQVPDIDPSVGNGSNVPYYNGKAASTPSDEITYAFNIERQLTSNSVVEVGYVGTLAANIQSNLLAYNQLNYANLPANLNPFTASGRTLLNSLVGSAAANAAGITPPWSGFNTLWGTGATVAQSLRPYPQYSTVDTINGQGDRIGHSTYHSMQVKFSKRYSSGLTVQASYVLSKLLTDSDSRQRHAGRPIQPQAGKVDCLLRPDPRGEAQLRVRAALRKGEAVPERQERGFRHPRRLALLRNSGVLRAGRPSVWEPPSASPSSTEETGPR